MHRRSFHLRKKLERSKVMAGYEADVQLGTVNGVWSRSTSIRHLCCDSWKLQVLSTCAVQQPSNNLRAPLLTQASRVFINPPSFPTQHPTASEIL